MSASGVLHSYLPYTRIVYKMPETSVDVDRKKHLRKRERICREFTEEIGALTQEKADDKLWEVLGQLRGEVSGPKKLGTFWASYLYPIFQRIGIIKRRGCKL